MIIDFENEYIRKRLKSMAEKSGREDLVKQIEDKNKLNFNAIKTLESAKEKLNEIENEFYKFANETIGESEIFLLSCFIIEAQQKILLEFINEGEEFGTIEENDIVLSYLNKLKLSCFSVYFEEKLLEDSIK